MPTDAPSAMDTPRKPPKRLSAEAVVLCLFTGVLMPVVCFVRASRWQPFRGTSNPRDHLIYPPYLLEPMLFVAFVPLMIYAVVSVGLVAANLPRFGRRFAVRFGLTTGIMLAVQYFFVLGACLAHAATFGEDIWLKAGVLPAVTVPLLFGLWVLARDRLGWKPAILFAIGVLSVGAAVFGPDIASGFWPRGFWPRSIEQLEISVLGGAPAWCLACYLVVTFWTVLRVPAEPTPRRVKVLLIGGWLAAYAAAWIYSAAVIAALKAGTITLSRAL